jgi:hypothetical protein
MNNTLIVAAGSGYLDHIVRRFHCLGMDSLDRLIKRGEDAEECKHEWRERYGHEWPIYAAPNGKEQAI